MKDVLVVAMLLLCVSCAHRCPAGTERVDLQTRIQVDVIGKDAVGEWHTRKGTVHKYADARIVVCIEYKDNVMANCLLISDVGEVVWSPERLLEEKV